MPRETLMELLVALRRHFQNERRDLGDRIGEQIAEMERQQELDRLRAIVARAA